MAARILARIPGFSADAEGGALELGFERLTDAAPDRGAIELQHGNPGGDGAEMKGQDGAAPAERTARVDERQTDREIAGTSRVHRGEQHRLERAREGRTLARGDE